MLLAVAVQQKIVSRNVRAALLQLSGCTPVSYFQPDSVLKSNEELCIMCLASVRGSCTWKQI